MYQFWLGDILFPVTPSAVRLGIKNQNKTVSLASGGEVNLPRAPGLTDISFTALLPERTDCPFAMYLFTPQRAAYYLERLERMKTAAAPVQFHIVRAADDGTASHSTHMKVFLEEYDILEDAEKYGTDTAVSVKLKQYAAYGTKVITLDSGKAEATEEKVRENSTAPARQANIYEYIVKPGDTLRTIAARILGDASRWQEIYRMNLPVIAAKAAALGRAGEPPAAMLYPGTVLRIRYAVG